MLIGVGVSCHISNSIVSYLDVSFSRLITWVGKERANFSAIYSIVILILILLLVI